MLDDNKVATGVDILVPSPNAGSSPDERERLQIKAAKEVILSAGSARSPQILLLSGIGPKDELEKHGVREFRQNIANRIP